jgi:4,5-dihydroxyphthalate decarboxylase
MRSSTRATPGPPVFLEGRIRRLFADAAGEALGYYRSHGWFPVMHVLALRQEAADAYPALPSALVTWYGAALESCRKAYDDPAWLFLPFGRLAYESTLAEFGANPWPSGFRANRPFLARFIEYTRDQQLVSSALRPEELFHASVIDT